MYLSAHATLMIAHETVHWKKLKLKEFLSCSTLLVTVLLFKVPLAFGNSREGTSAGSPVASGLVPA